MMTRPALALLFAAGILAGCSDTSDETTSSTSTAVPSVNTAPQIDADPTPQTSSGGDQMTASPDGTTNGAPVKSNAQ